MKSRAKTLVVYKQFACLLWTCSFILLKSKSSCSKPNIFCMAVQIHVSVPRFFARWGLNRPPIDHKIEFKAKVTVQAHLYFSSALSAGCPKIGQKFKYKLGSTHFLANLRLQSESQARKEMIRTLSVCLFACTVLLSICMN